MKKTVGMTDRGRYKVKEISFYVLKELLSAL